MPYGTIKVDNITFTNGGSDTTITVSGLAASTTGNLTVTGTISGAIVRATTVSGVTVTGTTVQGASGTFTSITGGVATITSGVFALGSAAAPSISFSGDADNGIYSPGANQVAISTNGAGRLFVDASGNVGVGGTPSLPFHIIGATDDIFYVERSADEVAGPNLGFRKSRGTTSSPTVLNSSDAIGTLHFRGYTGTNYATGVGLRAVVNGSPSGSRCPADFVLLTDNGSAFGERMRVTSAGLVGIGTSTPASLLHLRSDGNSAITHLQLHNRNAGASTESRIAFINSANDLSDNRFAYISAVTSGAGESGNSIAIATNANGAAPQERLRVTSAGRVGIGTTSPGNPLSVVGYGNATSGWSVGNEDGNTSGYLVSIGSTSNSIELAADPNNAGANSVIQLTVDGSERARIDSSGRLLVGTSSARGNFFNTSGLNPGVQLEGASYQNRILGIISSDNSGPNSAAGIIMARQMSGSVGGNTAVSNNDSLGLITFQGSDGAEFVEGARIEALADGTTGANDMPGRIVFSTTADGASSPTERMRIDSSGRVGIGVTSAVQPLDVMAIAGNSRVLIGDSGISNVPVIKAVNATNTGSRNLGYDAFQHRFYLDGTQVFTIGTDFVFNTGGSERARIDSSGRFLVGTSSARTIEPYGLGIDGQVANTYESVSDTNPGPGLALCANSTTARMGPYLYFCRSRSASIGSSTVVNSGDNLGTISFAGADGTDVRTRGAAIYCEVDGTPGANDMPGRLVFSTTADGASSPTERWRISSTGQIFQYSNQYNFSNSASTIEFVNRDGGGAKTFQWYVGASGGSPVATLSTSGVWTDASDARYKENIQDIPYGIDTIKQLKPRLFDIISTGDPAIGFVAQELKESVPEVVHEVSANDGEIYLNVAYGSLTAVLTKALQEAVCRVETLEAKVAALEGA